MARNLIGPGNPVWAAQNIRLGGGVLITSGGVKYAIYADALNVDASHIDIYKNIDTSDVANVYTINGSDVLGGMESSNIPYFDAVIDGNDVIHIAYTNRAISTDQGGIFYNTFQTSSDGLTSSDWTNAATYTDDPSDPVKGVSIDVDDKNNPHIAYVDNVKVKTANCEQIYHTYDSGGGWSTPTLISEVSTNANRLPNLLIVDSDTGHLIFDNNNVGFGLYADYSGGSWSSATELTSTNTIIGKEAIVRDSDGTVSRISADFYAGAIYINDTDTGYVPTTNADNFHSAPGVSLAPGTKDIYIFYVATTNADLNYIYDTGAGWTDGGVLDSSGPYQGVFSHYQYNHNNESAEINVLAYTASDFYHMALSLAAASSDSEGALAITGTGTLYANGVIERVGQAYLAGLATLYAQGDITRTGAASLSGTGTLYAAGTREVPGAASLSGTGSLYATGEKEIRGAVSLSGTGSLSAQGDITRVGAASFTGIGTLVAQGDITRVGEVSLAGIGTIYANGVLSRAGQASLSGTGTLFADGTTEAAAGSDVLGASTLSALASLYAQGDITRVGEAGLAGTGTLGASGNLERVGQGQLSGTGVLVASGVISRVGQAALLGTGTVYADGRAAVRGAAELQGIGSLYASGNQIRVAQAILTATATLYAQGEIGRALAEGGRHPRSRRHRQARGGSSRAHAFVLWDEDEWASVIR
jgi:hypothetical protein